MEMIKDIPARPGSTHPTALKIGEFVLFQSPWADKISIFHSSGEGGVFSKAEFEKVVSKFYDENF